MNSDYVKESTNRLNDKINENEILRKQNIQNKEEQEEKKSSLENLSDEDFDLMLEEMLKERKKKKTQTRKRFWNVIKMAVNVEFDEKRMI